MWYPACLILLLVSCQAPAGGDGGPALPVDTGPFSADGDKDRAVARGARLMDERRFDAAAEQFARALLHDPGDHDVRLLVGLALYAGGRLRESVPLLSEVAAARPDDAVSAEFAGRAWLRLGRLAEAEMAFERAAACAPSDAGIRNQLGLVKLRAGDPEEALRDFSLATTLDPFLAVAHFNAGVLLSAMGQPHRGIAHLELASALSPEDPDPAAALAEIHAEAGDRVRARHWIAIAVERSPSTGLLVRQGALARELGDLLAAQTAFETALAREDADAGVAMMLARVQEERGDFDAAMSTLDAAVRRFPGAVELLEAAADLAQDLGRDDRALRYLLALGEQKPAGAVVSARLSRLCEALGDERAAVRHFVRVLESNRGSLEDTAALARRMIGSNLPAIRNLEQGHRLAALLVDLTRGRDLSALLLLSEAEARLGMEEAARDTLERAARIVDPDGALALVIARRAAEIGDPKR